MTNVRRPRHLQLQSSEPAAGMVSSASGPGPFGESNSTGGGDFVVGLSIPSQGLVAEQPRPARTPAIRPTALVNLNCHQHQHRQNGVAPAPLSPAGQLTSPSRASFLAGRMRRQPQAPQLPTPTCCLAAPGGPVVRTPAGPPQPKALSPSGLNDSLPSLIMPHLYVGNQEQTNRETVNKLNIKYILSLGLLPIISAGGAGTCYAVSPSSRPEAPPKAPADQVLLPTRNSSRDFKIRIRTNSSASTPTPTTPSAGPGQQQDLHRSTSREDNLALEETSSTTTTTTGASSSSRLRDENQGVKQARSVKCKCINISDNSDQSLSKFFDEAFAFIEEARRKKCNILVHCLAGISRSPTIAIAYLMRHRSLHWRDAYDLVKQCRPQIDPNLNFMGQLRIYNRCLREDQQMIGCKRATSQRHGVPSALAAGGVGATNDGHHDDERSASLKSSKMSCGQGANRTPAPQV